MAPPLDRTWFNTLIDDDGSGAVGTVWNKVQIDGLLDTIDTSLAGLADKSGAPVAGSLAYFEDPDTIAGSSGLIYQQVPGSIRIVGASNYTSLELTDTSQAANQRTFKIVNSSAALQLTSTDDAGNLQATPLLLTRAGLVSLPHGRLQFPTTQAPSTDPYTQDDYREVDWTPAFGASGGASGQTYTEQSGKGIKIGRKVTLNLQLALSALGTLSGALRITGLPFPAATGLSSTAGGLLVYAFSPLTGSISCVTGYVPAGGQIVEMTYLPAGGGTGLAGLPVSFITSGTALWAQITYFAQN